MTTTESPASTAINPKLIVPFVRSVRSVFSTMVGVQTTVQNPFIKFQPAPTYDVSSIIGFSGDVSGTVVASFQKSAALKLVAAFAGMEIPAESPDFADAIGELANMIAGNAKKDLGAASSITVPSVVIGAGHILARLSDVPCVVVPVSTPVGDFVLEVSIKQTTPARGQ